MRRTTFLIIFVTILATRLMAAPSLVRAQGVPAFDAVGTDAKQVTAFLKTLQGAVAIDNRLKVAQLFDFPMTVSINGEAMTLRNESDFQARYSRIFDAGLKKSIASAKVETLVADKDGISFDGGRVAFKPLAAHKNALRVVAINEPTTK